MIIARRYCGPPESANGGYASGLAAALVGDAAEVTLRSPPPLDRELAVERAADGVRVVDGAQLVVEAKPSAFVIDVPPPPTFDEAIAASERYVWRGTHPYPTCFVCGPERAPSDGLRIFPGAVEDRDVAAAAFVPDASITGDDGRVRSEILWAVLDCPSWFGFQSFHAPVTQRMLLGRLGARIDARPKARERCTVIGWFLAREGRKIHCASAIHSESGALLAVARATWVLVA